MYYALNKDQLFDILKGWNYFLNRRVHLIACGGTAMTLIGVKASTKDVDFMVPQPAEYDYLIKQLKAMGYKSVTGPGWQRDGEQFHFDIFRGNRIHTTELPDSPLEAGRHSVLIEFSHLYVGILNHYDLISSKLLRGTKVDFEDCLALAIACRSDIDLKLLASHFKELVSYDIAEERVRSNLDHFLKLLQEKDGHE